MARKLRVEYPGAIYHVMNRGDRREPIFKDDQDYRLFLDTMSVACARTGWQVHAYVLMRNHFHLVLETPGANLVAGMKWLLGTYTSRFNRRHKLFGHLFSGRYKALIVDGSGDGYLKWDEEELGRCPKGYAAKARIAQRLRRETTVTHSWIAQRLGMGTASTVRKALWKLGQKS
jgi:REP element-mobilizing transposase RayT